MRILSFLAFISLSSSLNTFLTRPTSIFLFAEKKFRLYSSQYEESTNYPVVVPPAIAGNFGSDMLYRPDDEDSPEFKEYLRQLLKLQVEILSYYINSQQ